MLTDQRDIDSSHGYSPVRPTGRQLEFRVRISGLPSTASWQDLKDHMKRAGNILFAAVDHSGGGVVEFAHREDMHWAVRTLNETEFKKAPFDKSYIRVQYANQYDMDRYDSRDRDQSKGQRSSDSIESNLTRNRIRKRKKDDDDNDDGRKKSRSYRCDNENEDWSNRRRKNKNTKKVRDKDNKAAKQSKGDDEAVVYVIYI